VENTTNFFSFIYIYFFLMNVLFSFSIKMLRMLCRFLNMTNCLIHPHPKTTTYILYINMKLGQHSSYFHLSIHRNIIKEMLFSSSSTIFLASQVHNTIHPTTPLSSVGGYHTLECFNLREINLRYSFIFAYYIWVILN
jgi:hypothetical protein